MRIKRGVVIAFLLLVVGSVWTVGSSLHEVYQVGKQVDELEEEVLSLRTEQESLMRDAEDRTSLEYVEREARNRLNLTMPGDTVVYVQESNPVVVPESTELDSPPIDAATQWRDLLLRGLN